MICAEVFVVMTQKNIVCIVFIRKDAFFKDSVWNQQPYAKESYLPSLKGRVISIKKNYREMTASTWKISPGIVAYLLIKVLDLFTSEFEHLVIKVSRKSGFVLTLCLFLGGTSSKIVSS